MSDDDPYIPAYAWDMTAHRLEWWLDALSGLDAAHAKRLILEARSAEIAYLSDDQAERLIHALKLGAV